jgi:hypothetical protein
VTFIVPADAVPSSEETNPAILWSIKVQGDISFWPDLKEEFLFTVLPQDAVPVAEIA